jgi:hypothetical protein
LQTTKAFTSIKAYAVMLITLTRFWNGDSIFAEFEPDRAVVEVSEEVGLEPLAQDF